MEDANRSLEYQAAVRLHGALDRIIEDTFPETLPVFNSNNDYKNPFIRRILKEDLLNYLSYNTGYPVLEAEDLIIEDFLKRGQEAIEELRGWLRLWYSKWLERTQLITTNQFQYMNTKLSKYSEHSANINITPELMYQYECIVRETLIKNSEYACTSIMAKDIVFYALKHEYYNITRGLDISEQLRLMNVIIRRTKEIATRSGKLVFIRARD